VEWVHLAVDRDLSGLLCAWRGALCLHEDRKRFYCLGYAWRFNYEYVSNIFRTGGTIYAAVVMSRNTGRWWDNMSSESVCQVARSWVDVGSFNMRLVVRIMNFNSVSPEYFGYTLV
jgi:hypothetical protein